MNSAYLYALWTFLFGASAVFFLAGGLSHAHDRKASSGMRPKRIAAPLTQIPSVGDVVKNADVGDLRLSSVLGPGRSSVVYKADGAASGQSYAVKFRTDNNKEQFNHEVHVLTKLRKSEEETASNFPRIYAHDAEKKYIVMQLLDGYSPLSGTKEDVRAKYIAYLPRIMTELTKRLQTLHTEVGYVYGDIHRRNVFIKLEDVVNAVAVTDFALSVPFGSKLPTKNLYLGSATELENQPLHPVNDFERLAYVMIDLFYADLPWLTALDAMNANGAGDTTAVAGFAKAVALMKINFADNEKYFVSHNIPPMFQNLLKYCAQVHKNNDPINYETIADFFKLATPENQNVGNE